MVKTAKMELMALMVLTVNKDQQDHLDQMALMVNHLPTRTLHKNNLIN
ncbi:Uncharacterised protein [Mycobacteroides abscessus subsp. abscessus]|nr:Uncharacterised protein [Mycobacteroides abscessus subsp. abscessus]